MIVNKKSLQFLVNLTWAFSNTAPCKHIGNISDSCASVLGSMAKSSYKSHSEKGVHPELGASKFLDDDVIQKCQSLIGELQ